MEAYNAYIAKQQEVGVIIWSLIFLFVLFVVWLSNRGKKTAPSRSGEPDPNGMVARVTSMKNFILQQDSIYLPNGSCSKQYQELRKGKYKFHPLAFEMMQKLSGQEIEYLKELASRHQYGTQVLDEFAIQYRRWSDKKKRGEI